MSRFAISFLALISVMFTFFIFMQFMQFIQSDISTEAEIANNSTKMTASDLIEIDPAEPFKETSYFKDTDFNVTILDKKYHHSAVLSDDYKVIFRINENGDIRTIDNMKTYYSVETGKTYPASFQTRYEIGSDKLQHIGYLNEIKV